MHAEDSLPPLLCRSPAGARTNSNTLYKIAASFFFKTSIESSRSGGRTHPWHFCLS